MLPLPRNPLLILLTLLPRPHPPLSLLCGNVHTPAYHVSLTNCLVAPKKIPTPGIFSPARVSRWAQLMTELNFGTASGKTPIFKLIGKTNAECVALAAQPETECANTLTTWLAELHLKQSECGKEDAAR